MHLIASSLHSGVGDKEKSKSLGGSQPTIATSSISVGGHLGLRATSVVLGTFLSPASIFQLCSSSSMLLEELGLLPAHNKSLALLLPSMEGRDTGLLEGVIGRLTRVDI